MEQGAAEDKTVKWNTLEHSGVLFPPEYTPHGVKMLYDGRPVDLTPEQEEVCALGILVSRTGSLCFWHFSFRAQRFITGLVITGVL